MENILYPIARDKEGNLFDTKSAQKDKKYYCINCNNEMIFKSSGKYGSGRKRPHFSHKSSTNCKPETVLHILFKELVVKKLNDLLASGNSLEFYWNCKYCNNIHQGNYSKKLKRIELEYNLNFCRPDIALLDNDEEVYAVIEIVVTHKPEEKVLNYYYDNDITLIQINLKSDEDIYKIDQILKTPDFVNLCFNHKCEICNNYKEKFTMSIIHGKCDKCFNSMNIALMTKNNNFSFGPEKFNKDEILFAKNKGVLIDEKYFVNTCGNCGKLLNKKLNLKSYFSLANQGSFEKYDYLIKYDCKYCKEQNISEENRQIENFKS